MVLRFALSGLDVMRPNPVLSSLRSGSQSAESSVKNLPQYFPHNFHQSKYKNTTTRALSTARVVVAVPSSAHDHPRPTSGICKSIPLDVERAEETIRQVNWWKLGVERENKTRTKSASFF